MPNDKTAAESLEGEEVASGWNVIEKVNLPDEHTGGHFSIGYRVESDDGQEGYLKAIDYSRAMNSPDPARRLEQLTNAFNFERDILEACARRGFDRIVVALTDGQIEVPDASGPPTVQFLIFRLADTDLRTQLIDGPPESLETVFRILHHTSVGLQQLHSAEMVHQDVKPSNVLEFDDEGSKLADLGRASYKGHKPPHREFAVAGDKGYAPPELLYGHVEPDWDKRRRACDLYLLGSLIVSIFLGNNLTTLLRLNIKAEHSWRRRSQTYEDALPYIRRAFNTVLEELEESVDDWASSEVVAVVRQLCEPDPGDRGHPRNHSGHHDPYSLQRYVTKFDRLKRQARIRGR